MNLLKIDRVSKSFRSKQVLTDISFEVEKGEVVAIIGPSGSGKTTLLRCAAMLERADGGTISMGGVTFFKDGVLAKKDVRKEARRKCGMVFQNFNLFPHMSVLENIIDAPVHIAGVPRAEAVAEAEELLKKMELSDHAAAYPCELSGGQQQRVAIARALALHPEILFFDEPTSALDPELTQGVLRVIRDLAMEKMTMVIVTHEMDFAEKVADRIIFMADGVVVESGTAKDIIHNPAKERTKMFIAGLKTEM
ncbi:MAG: amino acid ABC transporter ATP-binding protein [Lentisphaerae bacterium]|nr:amino acid ABC transporter ATP-binding protein [Lentisphaerota bacterium]